MRYISIFLLSFFAFQASGQSFLPLDPGNQWTYRERGGTETFTMRVGSPVEVGDRTYYPLSGYASQTLPVRFVADEELVFSDSTRPTEEFLLTSFEPLRGIGWFFARFRSCDLEGQGQPERDEFKGPAGRFEQAFTILYRTFTCADEGILNETYVPGVGMVQRTLNSIRGPRIFDLVSARIGKMTLNADPGAYLRVAVSQQPDAARASAHLDLAVEGDLPVTLHYLSSQEFDIVIRNRDGSIVWQWSDGRVFTPSVRDENTSGRSWDVEIPLTDRGGTPLAPGTYLLEAWIVSGFERPQFVTSVNVVVPDQQPAASASRP